MTYFLFCLQKDCTFLELFLKVSSQIEKLTTISSPPNSPLDKHHTNSSLFFVVLVWQAANRFLRYYTNIFSPLTCVLFNRRLKGGSLWRYSLFSQNTYFNMILKYQSPMKMSANTWQKMHLSSSSQLSVGVLTEASHILTLTSAVNKWGQAESYIPTLLSVRILL